MRLWQRCIGSRLLRSASTTLTSSLCMRYCQVRICVDLPRNFNDFQTDEYFRFSSVRDAVRLSQLCEGPAFYVKLDISACYLSFPIHTHDYKYFVCAVGERLLQFTSIVFGDSDAPRKVSLSLDVVSSAVYDSGIAHTRHLDDFWIVAATAKRAWLSAHRWQRSLN